MKPDIFQAIADPTRRAILTLIAIQALTPNAMAEKFDMSRQAVSKHIKVLHECELIKPEQSGREIYYHFNAKKMKEFDNWLAQFRQNWETQFNQLDINNKKTEKMNTELLFDFTVDKAAKTVFITREFDAAQSLVWDAFTKAEILDQWVAPKPWKSKTKFMDFKVGGRRFYAMVSPEGQERWAIQKYTSISPKTNFKMFNAFADKDENPELPGSDWDFNFSEQNGITKVSISIYNESLERLERMIEMGFKEGYAMQMKNLDEVLATLSQK
jgi:uncharacterized protein YndB with AHSA1/START domain/DNA-binding transcriptional ArsR family regulator